MGYTHLVESGSGFEGGCDKAGGGGISRGGRLDETRQPGGVEVSASWRYAEWLDSFTDLLRLSGINVTGCSD